MVIQENELLMALMGVGTLFFLWGNHSRLLSIKGVYRLGGAFLCMLLGWIFTLIEGFVWFSVFNFLEHACYMAGSILLVGWIWGLPRQKGPS